MFKKLFILLWSVPNLIFAYLDEPYHDSAFIGPPHTFYGLAYFSYYQTDQFWNKQGKKLPTYNKFNRKTYRLDMEYDINHHQALFLKEGYTMVDETLNGRSRGLEDLEASYQYLFCGDSCYALSGKATVIAPLGSKKSCVRYGRWGGEIKFLYSNLSIPQASLVG